MRKYTGHDIALVFVCDFDIDLLDETKYFDKEKDFSPYGVTSDQFVAVNDFVDFTENEEKGMIAVNKIITDTPYGYRFNKVEIHNFLEHHNLPCPDLFIPGYRNHKKTAQLPPYLDPYHELYAPEIALAVEAWNYVFIEKKGNASEGSTTQIENYLKKNYSDNKNDPLSQNLLDRIKTVSLVKTQKYKKNEI